ncbi:MAG: DUF2971 domain-containing protein [Clostridium sp.]|nr:DUF2971 domain-containing protein [Clostridium sp.]
MNTLYQYMSFERARYILRNNSLPLGHFSHYNDPYECPITNLDYEYLASVAKYANPEDLKKTITEHIVKKAKQEKWGDKFTKALITTTAGLIAMPILSLCILASISILSGYMSDNLTNDKKNAIPETELPQYIEAVFIKLINTYTSCFSKNNNNFLMWSHYANSHRGIVLGFDMSTQPFVDDPPIQINYSHQKSGFEDVEEKGIWTDIKNVLTKKHHIWEYEQEYRYFFDGQNKKQNIIWYDHNDNPVIKLSENAIVDVYLGCKTPLEQKKQIQKIVSNDAKNKNIKLHHSRLDEKKFSLIFD